MHIQDQAIVIKAFKFQESSLIVDCFTREHGIVRGLVKSRKAVAAAVPASLIHIIYKARLETQLGFLQVEGIRNYISLLGFNRIKLQLIDCLLNIFIVLLREGDSHPKLYDHFYSFLEEVHHSNDFNNIFKLYTLLELEIMDKSGYGLDLNKCVVSKSIDELIYISPKSGCAVSKEAGRPYDAKLFKMPSFYKNMSITASDEEVNEALKINEFFLNKRIFEPNNLNFPTQRSGLAMQTII